MSRAFVKEDDRGAELDLPVDPTPAPVTPEGFAALTARLADLQRDPSAAPHARQLAARMGFLQVVDEVPRDATRVAFGATVTVEADDGARTTWRIVGPDETGLHAGGVSVSSPVARALLGRAEGDSVRVVRPRGVEELEVIAVAYPARA